MIPLSQPSEPFKVINVEKAQTIANTVANYCYASGRKWSEEIIKEQHIYQLNFDGFIERNDLAMDKVVAMSSSSFLYLCALMLVIKEV